MHPQVRKIISAVPGTLVAYGGTMGVELYRLRLLGHDPEGSGPLGLFVKTPQGWITCQHVVRDKWFENHVWIPSSPAPHKDQSFLDVALAHGQHEGGTPVGWMRAPLSDVTWIMSRPEDPHDFVQVEGKLFPLGYPDHCEFVPKYGEAYELAERGCSGSPIIANGRIVGLVSGRFHKNNGIWVTAFAGLDMLRKMTELGIDFRALDH